MWSTWELFKLIKDTAICDHHLDKITLNMRMIPGNDKRERWNWLRNSQCKFRNAFSRHPAWFNAGASDAYQKAAFKKRKPDTLAKMDRIARKALRRKARAEKRENKGKGKEAIDDVVSSVN